MINMRRERLIFWTQVAFYNLSVFAVGVLVGYFAFG